MTANVIVAVERKLNAHRSDVFRAWTEPKQLAEWRGSPGWHVGKETVSGDQRLGGRHRHVKAVDDDPSNRVVTDGIHTKFFEPDVFVSRERITSDPGIDPDIPLELRVEFTRTGRDGTMVRMIQGPMSRTWPSGMVSSGNVRCSICLFLFPFATVLVSVLEMPEIAPSAEELAAPRAKKGGLGPALHEIREAIVGMPVELRKLSLVHFFQWCGMTVHWQLIALSIAKSIFGGSDGGLYEPVGWTGLVNGWCNIVTFGSVMTIVAVRSWSARPRSRPSPRPWTLLKQRARTFPRLSCWRGNPARPRRSTAPN